MNMTCEELASRLASAVYDQAHFHYDTYKRLLEVIDIACDIAESRDDETAQSELRRFAELLTAKLQYCADSAVDI